MKMLSTTLQNICKRIYFLIGFYAALSFSAQAVLSPIEEVREEYTSIQRTLKAFEEDTLTWAQSSKDQLPTFTDEKLVELVSTQCPYALKRSLPEMRQELDQFFTKVLQSAATNLGVFEKHIEDMQMFTNPPYAKEILRALLSGLLRALTVRTNDSSIPSTLPQDMETYTPFNRKIAEESIIRRSNQALGIKVLTRCLPFSHLDSIFSDFKRDETCGGYFAVLQAYALGLVDAPPLPDHYQYRVWKNLINASKHNPLSLLLVPQAKKYHDHAVTQLQRDDIKRAGIMENIALHHLNEYAQDLDLKEQQFIGNATPRVLEEAIDHAMEEIITALVLEKEDQHKKALKRAKKKEKERRKKQEKRSAELRSAEEEQPLSNPPATTLALETQDESADNTDNEEGDLPPLLRAEPLPSQGLLDVGFGNTLVGKSSADHSPFSLESTLVDISTPSSSSSNDLPYSSSQEIVLLNEFAPEEEEPASANSAYPYEPFVKLPLAADALVAEPLPAAKIPSLKPKVHTLWKEFWTTLWMEWDDFRTLFVNGLEFGFEPIGGSIRRFPYPLAFGSRRFFIAHEPHGGRTTMGPATLRGLREQLTKNLGWTLKSFQSE